MRRMTPVSTLRPLPGRREIEFVFEPQEEGGYYVYAPDLPGLHTQGEDLDDATESAREALALYVERVARGGTDCPDRRRPSRARDSCVSDGLPVVSGAQLIKALERARFLPEGEVQSSGRNSGFGATERPFMARESIWSARSVAAGAVALAVTLPLVFGTAVDAAGSAKRVTIRVSDHAVALPPGGLHAGINSLRILGSGTGRHHLAFWRLNPGVTYAQFDALLNSNTGDPETVSSLEGGNGVAGSGTPVDVYLVLPAGQYAITDLVRGNVTTETHTAVAASNASASAPRSIGTVGVKPKLDRFTLPLGFGRPGVYEFRNRDSETHELSLVQLAPGKTVKDLIMWAKRGAKSKPPGRPIGGFGALHGGGHGWLVLPRLARGNYALACFIPDAQGVPHLAMGMAAGFSR